MAEQDSELIYVFIPDGLGPIDRGELFEDPIDDHLREVELGYVSGGGSSLSDEQPDGSRHVVSCGIDVEAFALDPCLEALRSKLPELECPPGTQLHYRRNDEPLQDEFDGTAWTLGQTRTMMHPGFGV